MLVFIIRQNLNYFNGKITNIMNILKNINLVWDYSVGYEPSQNWVNPS